MPPGSGAERGTGEGLEELRPAECMELLATQAVGRVAVADFSTAPLVVPVNLAVEGDMIVFRSDYGSKFRLMVLSERPVSLEVDQFDPATRTGWSVLVQGQAEEIEPWQLEGADPRPWAGGPKSHWVRIVPSSITGRRIRLAETTPDRTGYL